MSCISLDCALCKHFLGKTLGTYICKAYPKGIPKRILFSDDLHDKVEPDQEGDYVFELKDKFKER